MYIDSHAHLTDGRYKAVKDIVSDCAAKNVGLIVDVGWCAENSVKACENAENFDGVYFAAGIHPSEASRLKDGDLNKVGGLLTREKCVALGEIGLDYHYEGYNKADQQKLFCEQIELAHNADLPIVIHSRDASNDVFSILKENQNLLKNGFLMHCYSESKEMAERYLSLGAYFAFGGVITFKNSKKDEIVRAIPLDRIMAETDCPYMSPEPFRGSLNCPQNVVLVYKKLAEIYGVEGEFLEEKIEGNFKRFFTKTRQ